ncbi:MAG: UvrD-helicase domain-containing protein [Nitrospirae bacterium]|nr:UvrD-helicase domain-containing protein [Nitrospirota bacterium]
MILDSLNLHQKEAVLHNDGPLLVIAGAGSGKTKVITHKIAHLVQEHKTNPNRILAITFTKKAAEEMLSRVSQMLHMRPRWISTFHSFCVKILRQEIEHLGQGYTKNFVIYDESDTSKIIKDAIKKFSMKDTKAAHVRRVISLAKQTLRESIYDYINSMPFPDRLIANVYKEYQGVLNSSNALDYDDIIYITTQILNRDGKILAKWKSHFDALLIDEYQDTNPIQNTLFALLAEDKSMVTVVGDPQQSIYGFRGAYPENILHFVDDFKAKIVKLDTNYRSTQKILEIANAVLAKTDNKWAGKLVKLRTDKTNDGVVHFRESEDAYGETQFIARKIRELVENGCRYEDIAVLMRMTFLSREFEMAFLKSGIPYQLVGSITFYERAEIKDLLAYLRFVINPKDSAAFDRIINTPARFIGAKTLAAIKNSFDNDWIKTIESFSFRPKQRIYMQNFIKVINEYAGTQIADTSPYTVLASIIEKIGYENYLKEYYDSDFEDRIGNMSELLNVLRKVESEGQLFSEFMEDNLLASAQDNIDDSNVVRLLTVHSSKGLEFPVVFVVGLEEGVFPAAKALDDPSRIEEERRLFYVSVTRAKDELYLTSSRFRMVYGNSQNKLRSRYVHEVAEVLKSYRTEADDDNSF